MRSVLFAQVRAHVARLLASTLAVVIAVGFVVATLVLNETARSTVLNAVGAQYVGAAAVVTSDDGSSLADDADAVAGLSSVAAVAPSFETSIQAAVPGRTGSQYLFVGTVADDPALRWQRVSDGALPDRPGEVAVSDRARAAVGDVLTVTTYDAAGDESTSEVTVTGIVDLSGDPEAGLYGRAFVTPEQAREWGAADPLELRVAAAPGFSDEQVRTDTAAALGDRPVEVRTGSERAADAAAAMMGNTTALAAVLLVFGTVAVLVAGLVIANTFAVLLAQRTRELALLRCVGATARQVRRSVLGEAVVTGLASSTIGVAAGIGLAAAVSALAGGGESPIPLTGLSIPWYAPVAGVLVGTLVTLLAALAPARAATRVAPLAALRPVDPAPLRSRPGVLRLVLGLLLLLPGVGLMALGVAMGQVLIALPGGVLSFLGIVLLAQRAVPPVVAAAGRLAGRFGGVPAQLAAGNATRNPRRTAATATALLIGVTLTSAFVVGAASTRATAQAGLAAEFPTDIVVSSFDGALPASLLATLEDLDGVDRGAAVISADVTGPDGQPTWTFGVDAAATEPVLRSTEELALPVPGQALLPEWLAETWAVRDGDPVALGAPGQQRTFTALVVDSGQPLMLTADDLRAVAPETGLGELWLRLTDGEPDGQVGAVDRITDVVAEIDPAAQVTGLVTLRDQIDEVLDLLLLVVTGLLGIAVLIALIGVGNTLALSVVERRQENGLLRALGLTRGQLRGLLAWEAVLVAGVAAVLGVLVGGAYGLIGAASVLGEIGEIVLSVPWLQVAVIVAVATVAGLLASVLPARRAARTSPVSAIAG
ncbi:FtsX-like permease family protein [Blastococcus haudaquaticus]|uniref:Putative ABC transport system permease protein n=1 Tax=Blastococcus haudaquaticus TaxID=1938745 RepID=A0A286GX15_9ACTN|nr:FtsX-like permease family protein [Blastococcus haudaquaticus]SOE00041.1 putative ABC transport system permease protein [Blastococcus haudaquaticus]